MKILITNDDGFDHVGHRSLRSMLLEQGHEVWSMAPMHNQSGVGMKLSLGKSVQFEQLDSQSWSCSGSPVDCVLFALHGVLPFQPDAVISGINAGANLSDDLWYSGTAAAAREASKWGVPALALSHSGQGPYTTAYFALFHKLLAQHLDALLTACELEQESSQTVGFLNINIPENCSGKIFQATKFEPRAYQNVLKCTAENEYMLVGSLDPNAEFSPSVDTWADQKFHVSISLSAFQALQPLSYQLACDEMQLRATSRAQKAMLRVLELGIL